MLDLSECFALSIEETFFGKCECQRQAMLGGSEQPTASLETTAPGDSPGKLLTKKSSLLFLTILPPGKPTAAPPPESGPLVPPTAQSAPVTACASTSLPQAASGSTNDVPSLIEDAIVLFLNTVAVKLGQTILSDNECEHCKSQKAVVTNVCGPAKVIHNQRQLRPVTDILGQTFRLWLGPRLRRASTGPSMHLVAPHATSSFCHLKYLLLTDRLSPPGNEEQDHDW